MFTRYALYYAPAAGSDLARLGAAWLGRDAEAGPVPMAVADLPGCRAMADLTVSARRYGLHGTLKPPMRLAEWRSPDDLAEAAAAWAAARAPVDLGPLVLGRLGRFLALVPERQPQALVDFAADLVRDLDRFRAPPAPEELARRRQHGLTPRQEALLAAWGYPFVMEELRFHVTLTDALEPDEIDTVQAAAEAHFAPVLGRPETMAELALFAEDAGGLFHLVRRLPLQG
jgi:putative phosphonate metabolism protein